MDNNTVIGKMILIMFVAIDLMLITITALIKKSRSTNLRNYTLTAEAVVTAMDMSRRHTRRNDRSSMWYPTFGYTVNGVSYTAKSNVGTTSKPYEVGDRIKIKVDPQNPQKYVLIDSKGFKIAFGVMNALSVFFVIFTVIAAVIMFNR